MSLSAAPRTSSYTEFEPFCQWKREEGRDVLMVYVPEFKKEQLRVQVNNRGILKISGERIIDSVKKNKFYKEVEVPKYCDANAIQAKLANGCLYVIMPKTPKVPSTEQTKAPEIADSGVEPKKSEAPQAGVEKPAPGEDKETAGGSSSKEKETLMQPSSNEKSPMNVPKPKGSVSRMKSCAKTSLNVAVAVAVLAALCSYVSYMYRSVILED